MYKTAKHIIKWGLFTVVMAMLLLPALQDQFILFNTQKLDGAFEEKEDPKLVFEEWLSSDYQHKKQEYLKQNFGLREDMVRLNNELKYTFYSKFSSPYIYEGKDGYLFRFYSMKYNTKVSDRYRKKLINNVDKLKLVSDYIDSVYGTKIILVITPQKEFFYEEYLTDNLKHLAELPEKLTIILDKMNEYGLPYINLNSYFISIKDEFEWPVYARGGIHWSKTASFFAMDTVIKFMETYTNEDLANVSYTEPEYIDNYVWEPDMDIYNSSNLIRKWDELPLEYAELIPTKEGKKPKVITIADSYFNPPAWGGIPAMYFDSASSYWYYNREFFNVKNVAIKKGKLQDELTCTDFIIVVTTIENLRSFAFGFVDEAYEEFIKK